jgi:SAM-dependent methyltransferase
MNDIETDTKAKYSDGAAYDPREVSVSLLGTGAGFSALLLSEKARLLLTFVAGKRVLDLGCGNGQHLADLASHIGLGVGVDFSFRFIKYATETFAGFGNLRFAVADARGLPLADRSVDCAYSFATIYYIDDIEPIYRELARVLVPGGVALLELGNARSLGTLVSRQYNQFARHSRRTIGDHRDALKRNGFETKIWRSFQLLPMWGDKPDWLQILRRPALEKIVTRHVGGRMIDEWISSLPGVRRFAFRHLVVAQKIGLG